MGRQRTAGQVCGAVRWHWRHDRSADVMYMHTCRSIVYTSAVVYWHELVVLLSCRGTMGWGGRDWEDIKDSDAGFAALIDQRDTRRDRDLGGRRGDGRRIG